MDVVERHKVFNRREAGILLSSKLQEYRDTTAVILGIPRGGVMVASKVSELLNLPLEVLPCRKIKDPADHTKSIGSVCLDEVAIEHFRQDLPQDYISHQITLLRNGLRKEWEEYYEKKIPIWLSGKIVIVVDDIIRSGDTMIACLKTIRKQNPLKIIVAAPLVSTEGVRKIEHVADKVVFIEMQRVVESGNGFYLEFPVVEINEVQALLIASKGKWIL
jgi:putative phosphoribosyl transferase